MSKKLYILKPEFIYKDESNTPRTAASTVARISIEYLQDWGMFFEWLDSYLADCYEVRHFFDLDSEEMKRDWENYCLIEAWDTLEQCYEEVKGEDE